MRRTAKTKSPSPEEVIAQDEWDFSRVPHDEIETCFYYEYARARDDVRKLVLHWREQFKDLRRAYSLANTDEALKIRGWRDETFANRESARKAFWGALAELTDCTCAQFLNNLPQFPETPWQKLAPLLPEGRKTFLKFYTELDGMRGGLREIPWESALWNLKYDFSSFVSRKDGELVALRIDWQHGGIEKVISDFSAWARKRNAALKAGEKKKKPRDSRYEHLKQLGVWRLKEKLGSWDVVKKHTCKVLGCKLYGDDDALWRKARLGAIQRTKEMFPILRAH